jgi:hypothetical protein
MRRYQTGVTFIGWLCLLAPVAVLGYAVIRVVPAYNNYAGVSRALEGLAKEQADGGDLSLPELKDYLSRRFVTESIDRPGMEELAFTREQGGWRIEADYEIVEPLFFNISLLLSFNKVVTIGAKGAAQ